MARIESIHVEGASDEARTEKVIAESCRVFIFRDMVQYSRHNINFTPSVAYIR